MKPDRILNRSDWVHLLGTFFRGRSIEWQGFTARRAAEYIHHGIEQGLAGKNYAPDRVAQFQGFLKDLKAGKYDREIAGMMGLQ